MVNILCFQKVSTTKGKKIYFSLPAGLSSYDFTKHKEAIEQYFNINSRILFAHNKVII